MTFGMEDNGMRGAVREDSVFSAMIIGGCLTKPFDRNTWSEAANWCFKAFIETQHEVLRPCSYLSSAHESRIIANSSVDHA